LNILKGGNVRAQSLRGRGGLLRRSKRAALSGELRHLLEVSLGAPSGYDAAVGTRWEKERYTNAVSL
jgi:hypothetical protein